MAGYSVFNDHEKTESPLAPLSGTHENLSSQGVGIGKDQSVAKNQNFFKNFLMRASFLLMVGWATPCITAISVTP